MYFYYSSFLILIINFCFFVLYFRGPLAFQFSTVTCLPSLNKVDYYYYCDCDCDSYYYYYWNDGEAMK